MTEKESKVLRQVLNDAAGKLRAEIDQLTAEALIIDPANVTKRPPAAEYSRGTTASNAPPGWEASMLHELRRSQFVGVDPAMPGSERTVTFGAGFHVADLFSAERVNCVDTSPCRGCGVHFRAQDLTTHMSGCEAIKLLPAKTV